MRIRMCVAAAIAFGATAVGGATSQAGELPDGGEMMFQPTAEEETFVVPGGVYSLEVDLVGADGAGTASAAGGRGARVEGTLAVEPGQVFYVNVGGNGSGRIGGFNGGANGGATTQVAPGGGGGATDIRTISRFQPGTLDSRVVVAGGGGGGGASGGVNQNMTPGLAGGAGGNVGSNGSGGSGPSAGTAGGGGGQGTAVAGGGAGSPGNDPNNNCDPASAATAGQAGFGGSGGSGFCGTGSGGGGGGGFFGGGGGGAGANNTSGGVAAYPGGGGGGPGSSLVPSGFASSVSDPGVDPSAYFAWTLPGTQIDAGPKGKIQTRGKFKMKSFEFSSVSPDIDRFECKLDQREFKPCSSPKEVRLKLGRHTFKVRAVQIDGSYDTTPAKRKVRVVKRK